ncbi:MAG: signal recognition particle-docking protein FtsY [Pseudomonadota bacterium]|uniref:signal recognition particle-docking protein FtsY n=1 Tax=Pseudoalteromonas spongiae TaxID=298657 RepID=UPI00026CAF19|nr:signal recognition particle-docking protein FtsY [Pseudoalteromonas spongiae]ATC97938.1 fused signal recognition particle receptor [Pseudoalteromonas spongiae UST010723-006]MEC8325820.1 signal recognition particle-docking protein FtsY [Pseudomonadota bacterium]
MAKNKFLSWLGFGKKDEQQQQEEARLAAEEQARLEAEEKARLEAEAEEKRQAEEAARIAAEAEEKRQAEQAARLAAEAEEKRQAEEAARIAAEVEEKRQAEQAARLAAEAEEKRQAEEAARIAAEAEEKRQAEEAARLAAEAEEKRQAEEARFAAEAEEKRQAEEAARLAAEAEEKRQAEEAARIAAEAEEKRQAEEARLAAEAEEKRQAEQAARLAAEAEEKRQSEEAARIAAEAEEKRQAEEAARIAAEAEEKRQAEEATRLEAEAEEKRQAEEAARIAAEAEEKRQAEEAARLAAEAEEQAKQQAEKSKEPKLGFFGRLKKGLLKTKQNIGAGFANIFSGKKIDDELFEELETQLLTADVGVDTTLKLIDSLTDAADRKQLKDGDALYGLLKEEMSSMLASADKPLVIEISDGPFVILMVGVNGVGKTTTIGKLAKQFQAEGKSVMLAAGDTFRAAAVEQLQVWGERNDIPVIAQHTGADSASVVFDALQAAKARNVDVLIADTAGRLQNKDHLMQELEKIARVMKKLDVNAPHEVMLTIDAGTGQNAISQVKLFDQAVGLTGISLTKLDGTAKGGVIFAVADQFNIPIRYIGVGEGIDDLRTFNSTDFIEALFSEE